MIALFACMGEDFDDKGSLVKGVKPLVSNRKVHARLAFQWSSTLDNGVFFVKQLAVGSIAGD